MDNKAATYQKMLAFLEDRGANLGPHATSRLASVAQASIVDMDDADLLHYQRVLEATIDNRTDLMDREAMKNELGEVVRERFIRGSVEDKTEEAIELRHRVASLEA